MTAYVVEGIQVYGIYTYQLLTWTFEEEGLLQKLDQYSLTVVAGPTAAPPHHRF